MNKFRLLLSCRLFGRPTGGLSRINFPKWARELAAKVDPDFGDRGEFISCFTSDVELVWATHDLLWVPEASYELKADLEAEILWLERLWMSDLAPRPLSSLEMDFVVYLLGGAERLRRVAVVGLEA